MAARFLPLAEVAEVLSVSAVQAYALVRSGELPAIQVGGRGQWRVEVSELEEYIRRKYAETRAMVATRSGPADPPEGGPETAPARGGEDAVGQQAG